MIDRTARDKLASILRSYMNEEITAFQFDDLLEGFRHSSSDKTVEFIAYYLWGCYDDNKDHKVVASKQTWGCFNRILLLLSSEAELEQIRKGVQWHSGQVLAGICFLVAVFLCVRTGWNSNLLEVTGAFGLLSMAIKRFNEQRRKKEAAFPATALDPFPSFRTLSIVRRNTVGFSRKAYPTVLVDRQIRNPIVNWIFWVLWIVLWVTFSPIVLFVQTLPEKTTRLELPQYQPQ